MGLGRDSYLFWCWKWMHISFLFFEFFVFCHFFLKQNIASLLASMAFSGIFAYFFTDKYSSIQFLSSSISWLPLCSLHPSLHWFLWFHFSLVASSLSSRYQTLTTICNVIINEYDGDTSEVVALCSSLKKRFFLWYAGIGVKLFFLTINMIVTFRAYHSVKSHYESSFISFWFPSNVFPMISSQIEKEQRRKRKIMYAKLKKMKNINSNSQWDRKI